MSGLTRPTGRFLGRPDEAYPGYVPGPADEAGAGALRRTRNRAGRLWLIQAITGVLLVVFLGVHLVAQHLLVPGGLRDYAAVVASWPSSGCSGRSSFTSCSGRGPASSRW